MTPDELKSRIAKLRAEIARHDELYYRKAEPEIPDIEYDRLKRALAELEADFPELALTPAGDEDTSPASRVGDDRTAARGARRQFIPAPLPPVIYEDDALIAFDKPSGLLVAPDRWDKSRENLMGLVHAKLGHAVANVHRIDAGTSGIVLCAKTKHALDFVSGQFQAKTVRKKYLALTVLLPPGRAMKLPAPVVPRNADGSLPDAFAVDLGLDNDEANPGRVRVFRKRGGKPSRTEFSALEKFGRHTLHECRPLTGRTHQIRVHLAAAGAPCLNDPLYGDPAEMLLLSNLKRRYKGRRDDEKPLIGRLALHASELALTHPLTREPVTIRCGLPGDFAVALKYLRKFSGREKG